MSYVAPEGPYGTYAIVGEAPSEEEVNKDSLFSSPGNKLLWPLLRRLAHIERHECYVTALSKFPVGDEIPPDQFEALRLSLMAELAEVAPTHILSVGVEATRALLGDAYSKMEVHNGMTYISSEGFRVTPCWNPGMALGDGGKDPLAWVGDAVSHWRNNQRYPRKLVIPQWSVASPHENTWVPVGGMIGVDTEGMPDDPICLTWATKRTRTLVWPEQVPAFWKDVMDAGVTVIFQNAPHDWAVLEAMGVPHPERTPFRDTMELAYLKQTEPQGLKDMAYRHWGVRMKTYEDVVMPHYNEVITAIAAGRIDAGTTITTHSPKTGKPYKTPKVQYTDEAKALRRTTNPETLAKRIGDFPEPSLRFVPFEVMAEYATLDPFVTLAVWEVLNQC